jgi:uncharacterized protein YecT (DUF1311 family)
MKKLLLLLFLIPNLVMAASFDCAKASTKHEKMICDNPELNQADEEMGNSYSYTMQRTDSNGKTYKNDVEWMKLSADRMAEYAKLAQEVRQQTITSQKSFNLNYKKCKDVTICIALVDEQRTKLSQLSDPIACFQPMDTISQNYCDGLQTDIHVNENQKYYEAAIRRYSTMKDEDMGVGESAKEVVEELKAAHQSFESFRKAFCGAAYSQAGGTRRGSVYNNCIEVLTQRYTYQLWDQFLSDGAGRKIPGYPPKPKITSEILL